MNTKKEILEAYKKTEKEWENFSPKQKAKKLLDHLRILEAQTSEENQIIDNQILIIEELDPEEIEEHLDKINKLIMENAKETLNINKD